MLTPSSTPISSFGNDIDINPTALITPLYLPTKLIFRRCYNYGLLVLPTLLITTLILISSFSNNINIDIIVLLTLLYLVYS
jgi:hypothetical protein